MKVTLIVTAIFVAVTMAPPGAVSLKRSFIAVRKPTPLDPDGTVQIACIECPCPGFTGACDCVPNGCCCSPDHAGHVEEPTYAWKQT